jgi:PBP1b-binding outer membrane lipoprotein LpoB
VNRTARMLLLALALVAAGCSNPAAPVWDRKDAHRFCAPAIDAWPASFAPPCAAMHMCMNEARLTDAQRSKLLAMIRSAKDCGDP